MKMTTSKEARRARAHVHGLTLVEILAVVVILGLIAGTLTISFSGTFGRAKSELARSGIAQVAQKLEAYRMEKGTWPAMDQGLAVLTLGIAVPTAPYFLEPDQLVDPWGRAYLYVVPGPEGRPFEVLSYGADGHPGGEGEDKDISSAALRK